MVLKSTHAPIWPFSRAETGGREAMGACERTARRLGVWATRRLENLVGLTRRTRAPHVTTEQRPRWPRSLRNDGRGKGPV